MIRTLVFHLIKCASISIRAKSVHKEGGGWIKLELAQPPPYTIDLLQFSEGEQTQLVPPVSLESGKYTQIRLGVTGGEIVHDTNNDGRDETELFEVPSENLKTDKNFDFEVEGGGAVDLTVDFALSQSIVDEVNGTYKLKPVLHLVGTTEAATIQGTIKDATFGTSTQVEVTVIWDQDGYEATLGDDQEYTKVIVTQNPPNADTQFSVFWLVPSQSYIVEGKKDTNGDGIYETEVFKEYVSSASLGAGAVVNLGSL